jgi:PKD repeat protein
MLVPQTRLARFDRRRHRAASTLLLAISIFAFLGCQSENGNDANQADTGAPIANFAEAPPNGQPGVAVQFTDTTTGTVSSYAWNFGALGTSTEANPVVVYPDAGTYSVSLTVQGIRGTSQITKTDLIQVGTQPIAGFSCTPTEGFAPTTVNCIDESSNGTETAWDFGDDATATGPNASHEYTTPGNFVVTQTVSGPGGSDQTTGSVDVFSFGIIANPANGTSPAPADVSFTADTGGQSGTLIWTIEGVGTMDDQVPHRFNQPGTYPVNLVFGNLSTGLFGDTTIDYVVGYGPATADFTPSVPGGPGPLSVTMIDDSTGEIDQWEWDFGDKKPDGSSEECIYPAPAVPGPIDVCDSSSPSHEYADIGIYNVSLIVSGPDANPANPPIVSAPATDQVRVYIVDPSFELQIPNDVIGGAWTSLRPDDATELAEHTALTQTGGADAGMPSDGDLWASLDGLGTDGLTSVEVIKNGIQQSFLRPVAETVLEFDYVLLYAEPPSSTVMDAVTATVSDGIQSVDFEIQSARADVSSPYAGPSTRFPTRDGSEVRVTPLLTASVNLAEAFPSAPDTTEFTLTIRTSNAVNEFRSPRAYVDNIRFTAPADTLTANFELLDDPVFAGQEVAFMDTSCVDPTATACEDPTSWRWGFDTQLLLPVPPEASGSGDQDPVYTFPEAGVYDVTLRARLADLDSGANLSVTVFEETVADFDYTPPEPPYIAPATLTFTDQSTSDPANPITAWSWDFGGWGISSLQNPPPVTFGQAGNWIVRLTITTASGNTDTAQATISVE